MKKLFELHQKITLLVNEYAVLKDQPDGSQQLVAFAKQKRLTLRERFTLFTDESQSEPIASSLARSVLDFGAVYDISDANGKNLASVQKDFKKSLLNSSWKIYSDDQLGSLLFRLQEKNQWLVIFRRLWGFIPYADDVPFPFKYHFVIKADDQNVGEYIKITRFRDHYALYMEEPSADKLDERVWMVMAVLLDAMQSR